MSEIQSTRHAPTFTAITTVMPPQQSQRGAASALASLGSMADLVGGAAGVSRPDERYVALMQSVRAQLARTEQAADAVGAADRIVKTALLYAPGFKGATVRITQQLNCERPLREFKTPLRSAAVARRTGSGEVAMALTSTGAANIPLIEPLRSLKLAVPVALQTTSLSNALSEMMLEDCNRLSIPTRLTMTGLLGSLLNAQAWLKTAWLQAPENWAQIFRQFGTSVAAIKNISQ